MKLKIETYKDKAGEHRWRVKAKNGRVIAAGTEGYKNKSAMMDAISAVQFELEYAEIEEVDE